MKAAFQQKFFKPDSGMYDNGTQTSSILPLCFGMVPAENREPVFDEPGRARSSRRATATSAPAWWAPSG